VRRANAIINCKTQTGPGGNSALGPVDVRISQMARVTIRYWAAAKEAAGVAEESIEAVTLSDLLNTAVAIRKPDGRLATVLARSSFLVNADPVGHAARRSIVLDEGSVIEVLPPFAGG
jgi:molybdopterin synthase sulfur carrier subunit